MHHPDPYHGYPPRSAPSCHTPIPRVPIPHHPAPPPAMYHRVHQYRHRPANRNVEKREKHAHGVLRKTTVGVISGIAGHAWLTVRCTTAGLPLARPTETTAFGQKPSLWPENHDFWPENHHFGQKTTKSTTFGQKTTKSTTFGQKPRLLAKDHDFRPETTTLGQKPRL